MEYPSPRNGHRERRSGEPRTSRSRARPRAERQRSQPQHSPGPDIEALADSYYETGGLPELTQPTSRPSVHPPRLSSGPRPSCSRPTRYDSGLGYHHPLEVSPAGLYIPPKYEQRIHADYAFHSSSTQAAGNAYTSEPPPPGPPPGGPYLKPPRPWDIPGGPHPPQHLHGGPPPGDEVVEPEQQPLGREIMLYFFYMRHGKSIRSGQTVSYITGHPDYDDPWFARILRRQYKRMREPISLKGIGFVNFLRYERQNKNNFLTAKEPVIPYTGPRSTGAFRYLLRYPQDKKRKLVGKLDALYQNATDRKCFMTVEIVETVDAGKIYWGLGLIICLSLATALTYALLRSDVSGGFTIASYMIACLALVGALLAAGEWFGLAAPDASAYQLDLETGDLATTCDVGRFVGTRLGRGPVQYYRGGGGRGMDT